MAMTKEDIQKYKALYVQTARGYVTDLQRNIAVLLKNPEDNDALNVAYLAAHSLNSQSVMMNYHTLGALAQLIEQVLQAKKEKSLALKSDVLLTIDGVLNQMVVSLYEIEKSDKEVDLSGEIKRLQDVAGFN